MSEVLFKEADFWYKGLHCVVLLNIGGWRCGYVDVGSINDMKYVDYQDLDQLVDCHGGLTYSADHLPRQEHKEGEWWIGFDCAHYMDGYDYNAVAEYFGKPSITMYGDGVIRTLKYVMSELMDMVDAIRGDFEWQD